MKKVIEFLKGILPVIVYFLVSIFVAFAVSVCQCIGVAVDCINKGITDATILQQQMLQVNLNMTAILVISTLVALIIIFFMYLRFSKRHGIKLNVNYLTAQPKNILLLVLFGIAGQFSLGMLLSLIDITKYFPEYGELMKVIDTDNIFIVLLISLLAPVVEELMMRGMAFERFKKIMPIWVANIIQAFIFGLIHGNIVQGVYAFLIGLVLGYIYMKFKTILAPIFAHAMFNLSSLLIDLIPQTTSTVVLTVIMLVFAVIFAFTVVMISKVHISEEKQLEIIENEQ